MDLTGWSRKKTCVIDGILMFILSVPCILGFNVLSGFTPLGAGTNIMDLEDFIVSNVLLPLGSLTFVIFCTCRYGWGWDNYMNEVNTGNGLKVPAWLKVYMKYILPIIIIAVLIMSVF